MAIRPRSNYALPASLLFGIKGDSLHLMSLAGIIFIYPVVRNFQSL